MSELEQQESPELEAPAPEPEEDRTEEMIPKSKVEEIIKKRLERDRRNRQSQPNHKETESKSEAKPNDEGNELKTEVERLREEFAEERSRREFVEATAGKTLSKAQRDRLYKLYRAEGPEDPDTWVDETLKDLGLSSKPTERGESKPKNPDAFEGAPQANRSASLDTFSIHPNQLTKEQVKWLKEQPRTDGKRGTRLRQYIEKYHS